MLERVEKIKHSINGPRFFFRENVLYTKYTIPVSLDPSRCGRCVPSTARMWEQRSLRDETHGEKRENEMQRHDFSAYYAQWSLPRVSTALTQHCSTASPAGAPAQKLNMKIARGGKPDSPNDKERSLRNGFGNAAAAAARPQSRSPQRRRETAPPAGSFSRSLSARRSLGTMETDIALPYLQMNGNLANGG